MTNFFPTLKNSALVLTHYSPLHVSSWDLLQSEIMLFQACYVSQLKGLHSAGGEGLIIDKVAFFLIKTGENFTLSSYLQSREQEKRKLIRTSYMQCFAPD